MFEKEISLGGFATFALILIAALGLAKLFPILGTAMDQWAADRQAARAAQSKP